MGLNVNPGKQTPPELDCRHIPGLKEYSDRLRNGITVSLSDWSGIIGVGLSFRHKGGDVTEMLIKRPNGPVLVNGEPPESEYPVVIRLDEEITGLRIIEKPFIFQIIAENSGVDKIIIIKKPLQREDHNSLDASSLPGLDTEKPESFLDNVNPGKPTPSEHDCRHVPGLKEYSDRLPNGIAVSLLDWSSIIGLGLSFRHKGDVTEMLIERPNGWRIKIDGKPFDSHPAVIRLDKETIGLRVTERWHMFQIIAEKASDPDSIIAVIKPLSFLEEVGGESLDAGSLCGVDSVCGLDIEEQESFLDGDSSPAPGPETDTKVIPSAASHRSTLARIFARIMGRAGISIF